MKFRDIPTIKYEGPTSKNALAFKFYNPTEKILGKPMESHLKFAMAWWHTMTNMGADMFGAGTAERPWDNVKDPIERAKVRVHVAFEMMEKLGIKYFCFHDRDLAPEMHSLEETNRVLDEIVDIIEQEMKRTGIKLLWGTTNSFTHPRFVHGAGTSCNADVFAYAACQIKKAMEITKRLNGAGYVFWGGREGYETLLNTDVKFELDNFARLLQMAVDYAKKIGFTGQFYIEPKAKEPTKHQYDFDASTVIGFLEHYHLDKHFKLNIETNHALLATHEVAHELKIAIARNMLGSIDANDGDPLLGWDVDKFPTNIYWATFVMYEVIRMGGFTTGGLNFDAHIRRGSMKPIDLVKAHLVGIDTYALGLRIAAKLWESRELETFIKNRYQSYQKGIGKEIIKNNVGFLELEKYIIKKGQIDENKSGDQESLESLINQYIVTIFVKK